MPLAVGLAVSSYRSQTCPFRAKQELVEVRRIANDRQNLLMHPTSPSRLDQFRYQTMKTAEAISHIRIETDGRWGLALGRIVQEG